MKDESRESYNSLAKLPQTLSELHVHKPRQQTDNQSQQVKPRRILLEEFLVK